MSLDPEIRALIVCPTCRGELVDVPGGLRCDRCAVIYPIVDDVPWLVASCAEPVERERGDE